MHRTLAPRIYEGGAPQGAGGAKKNSPSQNCLKTGNFASPLLKAGAEGGCAANRTINSNLILQGQGEGKLGLAV